MIKTKFGNKRCIYNGIKFDSLAEKDRYIELLALEQAGKISGLKVHGKELTYSLVSSFKYQTFTGEIRTHRAITYIPDFGYFINGKWVIEDVKGLITDVFKIKHKLFSLKYPEIILRIIKPRMRKGKRYFADT